MADTFDFSISIYSPRWGHDDNYNFSFSQDKMDIRLISKEARCKYVENKDPEWIGYEGTRNPFVNILTNDGIYPPVVLVDALETIWLKWRVGEINDQSVEKEIQILFDWINKSSMEKPNTEFWSQVF